MSYYKVKVEFKTGEFSKSGKERVIKEEVLVEAESTEEANIRVNKDHAESGSHLEMEITDVSKTRFERALLYSEANISVG